MYINEILSSQTWIRWNLTHGQSPFSSIYVTTGSSSCRIELISIGTQPSLNIKINISSSSCSAYFYNRNPRNKTLKTSHKRFKPEVMIQPEEETELEEIVCSETSSDESNSSSLFSTDWTWTLLRNKHEKTNSNSIKFIS